MWRRERDSNPRDPCEVYAISSRAPSTTRPSLHGREGSTSEHSAHWKKRPGENPRRSCGSSLSGATQGASGSLASSLFFSGTSAQRLYHPFFPRRKGLSAFRALGTRFAAGGFLAIFFSLKWRERKNRERKIENAYPLFPIRRAGKI